jgi:formylglycine-generating enzyme required for sulfatase activity
MLESAQLTVGLFISYRRESAAAYARALFETLGSHFGKHRVFMDVEGIEPGRDFVDVLERTLLSCKAMIVLIGPNWAHVKDDAGRRRLDDPKDFVRMEIASAIRRNILLVPVLIDGAIQPPLEELPADIQALVRRQSVRLDFNGWEGGLVALKRTIEKELPRRRFWLLELMSARAWGASAFVLLLVAIGGWRFWTLYEKQTESLYEVGRSFRDTKADGTFCDFCPDLVPLPQDSFNMGSLESDPRHKPNESPQHPVRILYRLAVGKYEISRAQFAAFADKSGYGAGHNGCLAMADMEAVQAGTKKEGSNNWRQPGFSQDDNQPVTCISWNDAQSYVSWLRQQTGKSYRLLTEAEWEYAARAGTSTSYSWGNDIGDGNANCSRCGSKWDSTQTSPVGSFRPNAFGLYDMHGNVREWVQDCYAEDYNGAPTNGGSREDVECTFRVMRGGAWGYVPVSARSAYRAWNYPGSQLNTDGFRIARAIP